MGLGHGSRRYLVPLLAVMMVVIFFDTQVREATGMAAIHVGCPTPGSCEALRMAETRSIVGRLGGTLSATCEDAELSLDVLLPQVRR